MCIVCALPCCWPDGSFGETFLNDNYKQGTRGTGNPNLNPYLETPPSTVAASFLRPRGDVISADQAFPGPVNPGYAQHPPNCAIDYWFHRLGLSLDTIQAETPSNFPTLPSVLPVFDDMGTSVSHISHTTPCIIYSQGVRILCGWTAEFSTGSSRNLESQDYCPAKPFEFH